MIVVEPIDSWRSCVMPQADFYTLIISHSSIGAVSRQPG